jgi:hypothetical protein
MRRRAQAFTGVLQGLSQAKEAGLSDDQLAAVARFAGVNTDES